MRVIGSVTTRMMELALLLVTGLWNDHNQHSPVVLTKPGRIQGFRQRVFGKQVDTFLGIPYATPPVKDLRFKAPLPVKPWDDVYQARQQPRACQQPFIAGSDDIVNPWVTTKNYFDEDCLYLNIWTPSGDQEELKPVLVWIFGGALITGSVDVKFYDGRILSSYGDVVVVSLNYRLGLLGFLASNTPESPGNMGFMDQALALKWIHDNIAYFGGDPNDVTLFSQSAGSISAGLHMISPMSRNLFKRAILQSGSPFFVSYLEDEDANTNRADLFARGIGCASEERSLFSHPEEVVQCLREIEIDELKKHLEKYSSDGLPRFGPSYGNDFLPDNPIRMVHEGNIGPQHELLIGKNRDEGTFFIHYMYPKEYGRVHPDASYDDARDHMITFLLKVVPRSAAELMLSMYFPPNMNRNDSDEVLKSATEFLGDLLIVCSTVFFAEDFESLGRKVYYYNFDYRPKAALFPEWMGVTHFEEVPLVFGYPLLQPKDYSLEDVEFSSRIMDTWLQFAKTGTVPEQKGIEWPLFSRDSPQYVTLNPANVSVDSGIRESQCEFWRYLYQNRL